MFGDVEEEIIAGEDIEPPKNAEDVSALNTGRWDSQNIIKRESIFAENKTMSNLLEKDPLPKVPESYTDIDYKLDWA